MMVVKMKKLIAAFLMVLMVGGIAAGAPADSDKNPAGNIGHANPAFSDMIYPGTDYTGFTNGDAEIGSPADLPDQNPHNEAPW